jgi:hypothetical protein
MGNERGRAIARCAPSSARELLKTMIHSQKAPVCADSAAPHGVAESLDRTAAHAELDDGPPSAEAASRPAVAYLSVGQIIADRYEVCGVLGQGGMGVVYRCRDRGGELVAVKRTVLPASRAQEHLQWFVAEAQALASLDHENIVRARDFGQLRDGTPYLVMDLVEGSSLQQVTADTPSFPLLWVLIDQVLAALAHAHARGVVHGDLKPTNILVDADPRGRPRVRLFDFGLAKRRRARLDPRLGQKSAPSHPPPSAGTPGYMAPEQILGRTSDICGGTDLYALGCILYRALAGHAPFGDKVERELDLHCYREPMRLVPLIDVPEGVTDVVMRLLLKRPAERPGSAAQLRSEWSRFRPVRLPELGGGWGGPATERLPGLPADSELEVTRRIGRHAPRGAASKLRRSRRWLPGLLSLRPSPLVGRAKLCRYLAGIFREMLISPLPLQRAVVLTGPAGIGKSRLADWLCTDAEERGTAVVLRGCQQSRSDARDGLAIALADCFNIGAGGRALGMLPAALAERCDPQDLTRVVDWLIRATDPASVAAASQKFHAQSVPALLRVLYELADGRPLLLWLDNLTHVSHLTRTLLTALPRKEPSLRLLIVTTVRPECLRDPTVADAIGALQASLRTNMVRVPALDSLTTSAMLRAALPIDPALALQIALDSGGVPLDGLQRLYAFARRCRVG